MVRGRTAIQDRAVLLGAAVILAGDRYAGARSVRDALFGRGMEKYALIFLMIFLFIVPAVLDLPTEYAAADGYPAG